ncbi:MAG: hypothetical protein ACI8P0_005011 [Planctomycetaceae bacterium]|jgi:hypothetical protein
MKRQSNESDGSTDNGKVDMSPEAIDGRLEMVSALYDLGKYLQTAQPVNDEVDAGLDSGNANSHS